ncbi:MAG: hypothetical protein KJ726_12045, partial [Verrucomicrobia bacterium]|nr:hypothetical protein [Verrucomicrobiota bacterium]
RIFEARPAVLGWLLSEQAIRDALQDALPCAECDFGVRHDEGPFLDLSHVPRLTALCRRVCAMPQALEYAGRPEETARAYVGLLRMIRWLDTDRTLASGLAAADMMQTVLWSMESFLGGGPPAEGLVPLADFFRETDGPLLHPADDLRAEAERLGRWLLREGPAAAAQMRRRIGEGPLASALAKVEAALAEEDRSVFDGWVAEYRSRMKELADAFDQPFAQGALILKKRDAERAALLESPDTAPNPLLVLLVPVAVEIHQRLLLANAQWDMAALLCVAAERQARTGSWPDVPKTLAKRLGRAFPMDPFSGERMHYRVIKGRPVLGVRIPRAMAESKRWIYTLDVAERARRDTERTREAIRSARAIEFRELFEPAAP